MINQSQEQEKLILEKMILIHTMVSNLDFFLVFEILLDTIFSIDVIIPTLELILRRVRSYFKEKRKYLRSGRHLPLFKLKDVFFELKRRFYRNIYTLQVVLLKMMPLCLKSI